MKIGIIGSGPVGQALGTAFTKEGHQVKLGTRKPDATSWNLGWRLLRDKR